MPHQPQLASALNKLAGTTNLDATQAANVWAGLTASPPQLALVGALNVKAGNGNNPSNWRNLRAVCNQLAGLTTSNGANSPTEMDPRGALNKLAGIS